MTTTLSAAKLLALIAAGYAVAVACGFAAVMLDELSMSVETQHGSPGMVAFGDMVLFVVATGICSLVPTWFLLRLALGRAPRAVLGVLLLLAAIGPASWLALLYMVGTNGPNPAPGGSAALGIFIAFIGLPRMVAGPVLLAIEGAAIFLMTGRIARGLLGAAMLFDIVPLALFALHLASAPRY
jgi:hypothetical protein